MNPERTLGEFEQIVLLAVLRLGDEAYGVTILDEIAAKTGRNPAPGALYTTLHRMEDKGLVTFRDGAPHPSAEAAPSASSPSPAKAATPWPARNPPTKACYKASTCSTQNFSEAQMLESISSARLPAPHRRMATRPFAGPTRAAAIMGDLKNSPPPAAASGSGAPTPAPSSRSAGAPRLRFSWPTPSPPGLPSELSQPFTLLPQLL